MNKETLKDNYTMQKIIGKGSFGIVYLAVDKNNNKYAAKVERKGENSRLMEEYKIYRKLYNKHVTKSIPKIHSFMQTSNFSIMVMDLLGPSLDAVFLKYNKKFTLPTVLKLGYEFVSVLESLHKAGFIHRDIKPNNFLLGKQDPDEVYLTDFGLSRSYMKNNEHIDFNTKKSLIGTLRYASVNMHMGIEPSRRDDLESIGYMLIYFLKGSLPWQGLKSDEDSDSKHMEKIGDMKLIIKLDKLCDGIPKQFKEYIKDCKETKFDEEPNYDKLKNYFLCAAKENKVELKYQWCI